MPPPQPPSSPGTEPEPEPERSPLPKLPQFPRDFPDRAFKELMSDPRNLQDLTEIVAPQCADCLDCLNATIVPSEVIISEVPDSPKTISDIVYEIPVRAHEGIVFPICMKVIEHQSKPEEDVIFRAYWIVSARWKQRKQDWDRGQRPGPFHLTPGTAIIVYTGSEPWSGPKTLSQLIRGPQSLIDESPRWEPKFLEVRRYAPEQLLKMDQRLFQSLAVVRGQYEPAGVFSQIFTDAFQALTSLRLEDRGRWIGLARFLLSWGLAKRGPGEHDGLRGLARKVYRSQQAKAEIEQMMDTIIGATFQKGEISGRLAARREDLVDLLSQKFAAHMDDSVTQRIEATDDPNVLRRWVKAAGLAKSWAQFVKTADWPSSHQ